MKNNLIFLIFTLLGLTFSSCDNEENIPDIIKGIPVKIEVRHSPNDIYAEKDTKNGYYYWKHKTYVKALESNIEIIEFGTYNYKNGEWVLGNFTQKPYKADRFELWYTQDKGNGKYEFCRDGILKLGMEYCDETNYSVKNAKLVERDGLWYYLGKDIEGKLVCGYEKYHINPELKKD